MAFCLHCGERLPDGSARCSACGAPAEQSQPVPAAEHIEALVSDGRMIEAIKAYREATGAGLKEAKDAVEAWQRNR